MPAARASLPNSILLIEPEKSLAHKIQDLLVTVLKTALDLTIAGSLREGMTHLCTHPVGLALMSLSLPDYNRLDAVRAVRLTAPDTALIVYGAAPPISLLLDAVRRGAHDVFSLAATSTDTFRLAVECAMIRATLPATQAAPPETNLACTHSATMAKLVHDLNNTIMSINGFADLLIKRLPAEEPARVCSEQIQRAGTRAAELLKSLAPFRKPASSVMPADSVFTAEPGPILSSN